MWNGLEVSAFKANMVSYNDPDGLHVRHYGFGNVVPLWNEYNIWDWKWSFIFCTQFLSDSRIFLASVLHMQLKGMIGRSGCQSLGLRFLIIGGVLIVMPLQEENVRRVHVNHVQHSCLCCVG